MLFLDPTARKAVALLRDHKLFPKEDCFVFEFVRLMSDRHGIPQDQSTACLRYLIELKMIHSIANGTAFKKNHRLFCIEWFNRDEVRRFIFHSILVPIGVAFVTSILVHLFII